VIKNFKNLWKFDPKRDVHSNWQSADELDWAWLNYGPGELAERYRDARNLNASESAKFEMRLSLCDRIAREEILALGIRVPLNPDNRAELIPQILFQSQDKVIDWEHGEITGLGCEFRNVRICSRDKLDLPAQETITPASKKRGGGRRSQYPEAREVLQELYAEHPAYRPLSANRLLKAFNERYLAKFAPPGGSIAPVSERSLRDHLKDYRKELAGIGEDDFAN
jgi:hypothetical protein